MSIHTDSFDYAGFAYLIDNQVDSKEELLKYSVSKNLRNTFKVTQRIRPQKINGNIYGANYRCVIPKNGYLAALRILNTISCTGDNTTSVAYTGSLIFKNIRVKSQTGYTIYECTPEYILARTDSASSGKKQNIQSATAKDAIFNNNSVECYTIPFFHFQEHLSCFINTDLCEQLVVDLSVADSYEAMGLVADLTAHSFVLEATYMQFHDGKKLTEMVPRTMLSYDIYTEKPSLIPTGATSHTITIDCPYNPFEMALQALTPGKTQHHIKKFEILQDNIPLIELDRRTNWLFSDESTDSDTASSDHSTTGTLVYNFGVSNSKLWKSGYMPGSRHTYYLTVYFSEATADPYYLYTTWSYWCPVKIENGIFSKFDVV